MDTVLTRFLDRLSPGTGSPAPDTLTDELIEHKLALPICRDTMEETGSAAIMETGRNLVRQGDWEDLCALVRLHDEARDVTDAGTPLAELLLLGARSDLSVSLQLAARAGALSLRHEGIQALNDFCEDLRREELGYPAAVLAANTLMDAGWAWYEQGALSGKPERHVHTFATLFNQASTRLAPFSALEENAPSLAAAQCATLAGTQSAASRVADDYEDLIDLNPEAPGHMRAFGLHLLPQWFGSFPELDIQARRVAASTQDVWGAGGYAWVWLDALLLDPTGFAFVETDFFLEGLDDILARRPSQHHVNLAAAFLSRYIEAEAGPDRSQKTRMMHRRAGIVRGRMEELHPWVWAVGPVTDAAKMQLSAAFATQLLEAGHSRAQRALVTIFSPELRTRDLKPV